MKRHRFSNYFDQRPKPPTFNTEFKQWYVNVYKALNDTVTIKRWRDRLAVRNEYNPERDRRLRDFDDSYRALRDALDLFFKKFK